MAVSSFLIDSGGEIFTPGDPAHGVCWAPDNKVHDINPTWVRMDDPAGTRLATAWAITRGRQSETDKTGTGTASITFNDFSGLLDPTNIYGEWYGRLDPMRQVAIALMNPVDGSWHTLFTGYLSGPDHELEMFQAATRGLDVVTWNCVDAFDLFANVILTPGHHGDSTAPLTEFPNIYYKGTPSNLEDYGVADVEVHVDGRIVKLLDDGQWPGIGLASAPRREVFSGNVTVQGAVYARQDSLLQALSDAADAEFPGVANHWISKTGVYTFHGRYARFNWTHPGYGVNQWFVGGLQEAIADPNVIPLAGPLRFYRSKDDVINSSLALPSGVDPTSPGVVVAFDPDSRDEYGYRARNFENLLTSAGHDTMNNPTTMIEECNKFADYYVGNFKDPKTRVQTLRFVSRGPTAVGAAALWRLMTQVELGDVITLTTGHVGGGGFDENFFVEQIRYAAQPARRDMHEITLELEVSPESFYAYNPFGTGA